MPIVTVTWAVLSLKSSYHAGYELKYTVFPAFPDLPLAMRMKLKVILKHVK